MTYQGGGFDDIGRRGFRDGPRHRPFVAGIHEEMHFIGIASFNGLPGTSIGVLRPDPVSRHNPHPGPEARWVATEGTALLFFAERSPQWGTRIRHCSIKLSNVVRMSSTWSIMRRKTREKAQVQGVRSGNPSFRSRIQPAC